ncbi:hypothetical protein BST17_08570 [Mycolicibacterium bacteremicum]|uniref:DUF7257 domain-containing protein n=1 Tax=Mycolicibacterium bacteremicum TaxID=564198 RepID=A0A1W9Z0J9_MYCBA|nr:hypothetical protein BST17_08570 [Mycolicibacterium bacteremicum]
MVRYPRNSVTPQGAYYFIKGIHPRVRLKSPDGSVVFEILGGGAIADRHSAPECVVLNAPPKGLIATWKFIDQQGANEDGVTNLDAVNDAMEITLPVRLFARDGAHLRELTRALLGSLDKKKTSELSWFTQELGCWWGDVRHLRPPAAGYDVGGQKHSTSFDLHLRVDGGFWRTFDHIDEFRLPFDSMKDTFAVDTVEDKNLGQLWPLYFTGPGGGFPYASRGAMRWRDDPTRTFFTEPRQFVAGPYRDFQTATDNQVISIVFDSWQEWGASNDIWGRQGRTASGEWNGTGVRARITGPWIEVAAFNNFKKTTIAQGYATNLAPALPGERYRLECGGLDKDGNFNPRIFRVRKGGGTIFTAKDTAGVSAIGAGFRGVGTGGQAAGAFITQGTPAAIREVSAGDLTNAAPVGKLVRVNVGDQDMWDRYTITGPGTFEIGAGPGSSQTVKIGPLLPNQKVQLRSDGQKRRIVDLTKVPPTANELLEYRKVLAELESYAPIKNIGPTLAANASEFGVTPPQGNMHRLIDGWFTHPVPPKSPGRRAEQHFVSVKITGGNADSRVIVAGTPRRRYPQ